MKSIYNYFQPDFYHFSRNSIELSDYVAKDWQNYKILFEKNEKICFADLFSGSGVVCFEFFVRLLKSKEIDLHSSKWMVDCIEKQTEYLPIWEKNLSLIKEIIETDHFSWNFLNLDLFIKSNKKYDIILANPPFFSEQRSLLSENPLKKTCHFMKEDELQSLPEIFYSMLNENGIFYFLAHQSSLDIFWKKEIRTGELKVVKKLRDAVILFGSKLNKK